MTDAARAECMARARTAQKLWIALPLRTRIRMLAVLRRRIAAQRERLVEAIVTDTGKPPLDALSGDVMVTLEQMRVYERHAARWLQPRSIGHSRIFFSGCRFEETCEPHGVALIYGPANYPFQLAMLPAITALYAGNAGLLKVSERTPTVAQAMTQVCTGILPPGLLQVFSDGPSTASAWIDTHPDLIFFTGSSATGREIAIRAAQQLIPCVLELGGKDPALVFADCDLERTAAGIAYGAFANAGQVCVGIKRLYIEQQLYDRFLACLRRHLRELRVGHGRECDLAMLQLGPAHDRLRFQVAEALAHGAALEHGQVPFDGTPVVLSNLPPDAALLRKETFGPVLCVAPFASEAEAIALANDGPFALSASLWTSDLKRTQRIAAQLNAGTCTINDVIRPIANPYAAFGGNASSGYGRYHGPEGLRSFSRIKTVMTLRATRDRERHWFPLTARDYEGLDKLLALRHRPYGLIAALRGLIARRPASNAEKTK